MADGGNGRVIGGADGGVASGANGRPGKQRSYVGDLLVRLIREKPLGMIGAVVTLLLLLTGIFADVLAPFGMNESHIEDSLSPPSATYWLGADNAGRDILSRVIYGARISLTVGLIGIIISSPSASLNAASPIFFSFLKFT